jgi:hypothetical protein
MSLYQTATTSFKIQLAQGLQNFGPTSPDTFYIALYTASANLSASTTEYTTVGELPTGSGYTAGGKQLTITVTPTATTNSTTAYWSFDNVLWSPAAFTCRGAMIYNASKSNSSVCILDFGADKTCQNSFTIQFPTAVASSAILRIA